MKGKRCTVLRCAAEENKGQRKGFLSLEEAGLVEISGLSTHERFLCRLTVGTKTLCSSFFLIKFHLVIKPLVFKSEIILARIFWMLN